MRLGVAQPRSRLIDWRLTNATEVLVLPDAVKDVMRRQADLGIDIVNDGEFSKRGGFSGYVRNRLSGIEPRFYPQGEGPQAHDVTARDRRDFPGATEHHPHSGSVRS